MSKILVLGDIHGRMQWMDIIEKEKPDKTIFLGDYVSTHENITQEQQCINLEDILNHKQDNPDKIILLRGNHDLQHLGYYWAECSGFCREVYRYMATPEIKERFLKLTQWIHIEDDFIFSHAGISKTWFKSLNIGEASKENILRINQDYDEPSPLFAFTPDRMSDYYGESTCQPCTWIRPYSLKTDCLSGWKQVVGHTRCDKPGKNKSLTGEELWFIDHMPYGYMIIENGKGNFKTNFNSL